VYGLEEQHFVRNVYSVMYRKHYVVLNDFKIKSYT
jgi:hypothetical protein